MSLYRVVHHAARKPMLKQDSPLAAHLVISFLLSSQQAGLQIAD